MVIEIKNVSWKRENKYILRDITWSVKPGEHWVIMGLNGSGKTSLLNIINGYMWPTKGEIRVLGKKFGEYDLRKLRQLIGWVSSSMQEKLYKNETVENIVLSGKVASMGLLYEKPQEEDYEKAYHLLEQMGCRGMEKRVYESLSQGEKQRVLIARALMASPALLILDEPATGLDIFAREQLLDRVQEMGSRPGGPTMIYVSHHIEEIVPVFQHVLLLKEGQVYGAGRTESLMTSENLSRFFGTKVDVTWRNERAWMQME
ncbi:iron complex transport system ATP-binding protein [Aneurinibacillus thermoaerophilus]|uniref:Iron complex transport system ATP-binding protein n=1 Tax=Aneurinibacillus thermoaerophilus TaxID=143495 RepID=A0A1G8CGT5_ANETH|nr:ABC transporter ATP-binding protein [Aneurinibacillus thermoaerophilus]SDH44110.1 iron complex transport system ATP-binding protein [Aneurinibacillus thermoaerophilus]